MKSLFTKKMLPVYFLIALIMVVTIYFSAFTKSSAFADTAEDENITLETEDEISTRGLFTSLHTLKIIKNLGLSPRFFYYFIKIPI